MRDVAVNPAMRRFQRPFIDSGERHLRIGDDAAAVPNRLDSGVNRARRDGDEAGIFEIAGGVNGAFHNLLLLFRKCAEIGLLLNHRHAFRFDVVRSG